MAQKGYQESYRVETGISFMKARMAEGEGFLRSMSSSPTVTLFSEQVDPSRRPATLAASALIHAGVIALVSFGILYAPRIEERPSGHYVVRHLDLRRPAPALQRAAKGIVYPGGQRGAQKPSAAKRAPRPPELIETAHARPGPQTLIQPDLAARLAMTEEIPVPQVLIWTPRKTVVKTVVAPLPEPPTASAAKPSLDAPNQEVTVSDVNIASSPIAQQKLPILPSTSSPVVVVRPDRVQLPPSTVSQVAAQPTPIAVMSLSDLRMEGTATLPPVNESARAASSGVLAASPGAGTGDAAGASTGIGSGTGTGTGAGQGPAGPSAAATPKGRAGQPDGATTGAAQGANAGSGQDQDTTAEITLPKTGSFGSVVVGDSLQDQYPEMSGVWNGRMAYTVYLHVGLARSWILQYSLPPDARVALTGGADRLEAPWPYSIVRPNLASGAINADALMVHGFVKPGGTFRRSFDCLSRRLSAGAVRAGFAGAVAVPAGDGERAERARRGAADYSGRIGIEAFPFPACHLAREALHQGGRIPSAAHPAAAKAPHHLATRSAARTEVRAYQSCPVTKHRRRELFRSL